MYVCVWRERLTGLKGKDLAKILALGLTFINDGFPMTVTSCYDDFDEKQNSTKGGLVKTAPNNYSV